MDDDQTRDEEEPTQAGEKGNDPDAKGSLQEDDPQPGEGTGEGERGLGEQTGASGGAQPTEPEDASPERGQTAGN